MHGALKKSLEVEALVGLSESSQRAADDLAEIKARLCKIETCLLKAGEAGKSGGFDKGIVDRLERIEKVLAQLALAHEPPAPQAQKGGK